jgi:hypothetical protein
MIKQRSLFIVLIILGSTRSGHAMSRPVTLCYQGKTIPVTLYSKNIVVVASESEKNTTKQLTNFASIYASILKTIGDNSLNMSEAINKSFNNETIESLKTYNRKNFNDVNDVFDGNMFFVTTDNENPKDGGDTVIGIPEDVSKLNKTITVITHPWHTKEDCAKFTEICSTLFCPPQLVTTNEKKIFPIDQKDYESVLQNMETLKKKQQALEHRDSSSVFNNYYLKVGGAIMVIAGVSCVIFRLLPEENPVKKFVKKTVKNISYYVTKLYS